MTTDEIIDKVVDEWFDKKSSQFMTQESLINTLKTRINCGRIPLIGA
jgi:hypothetical protein